MGKSQQETTGAAGTASVADHGKSTWCPQAKAREDGTYKAQVMSGREEAGWRGVRNTSVKQS